MVASFTQNLMFLAMWGLYIVIAARTVSVFKDVKPLG